jgi:hypothetical protein
MGTQHIGAAGELLVQYRLLKMGIESAWMTTDAGVDLVVYAPGSDSQQEPRSCSQVSRRLLDAARECVTRRNSSGRYLGCRPLQIAE